MPYRTRRAAMLAALSVVASCTPLRRGSTGDPVILFDNQSPEQADVFAVGSSGHAIRIGTVLPGQRESLRVPLGAVGGDHSVNIVARILARALTPSTSPVTLLPGDSVEVTLPTNLRLLSLLPVADR